MRSRMLELFAAGAAFCGCVALLPVRSVFFTSLFSGALGSVHNYACSFPFPEVIVWVFYMFFCVPFLCIDMEYLTPFGCYPGDAISFIPSSSLLPLIVGLIWLSLLIYAAVKCRRCVFSKPLYGVIAFNLVLHGAIQYGLKEGFLYCLHHMPAQVLLAALLLRPKEGKTANRVATVVFTLLLASEIFCNYPGYMEMIAFLMR